MNDFGKTEEVIYLEGLFFLKKSVIKSNPPMVQNALKEIFDYVSYN